MINNTDCIKPAPIVMSKKIIPFTSKIIAASFVFVSKITAARMIKPRLNKLKPAVAHKIDVTNTFMLDSSEDPPENMAEKKETSKAVDRIIDTHQMM